MAAHKLHNPKALKIYISSIIGGEEGGPVINIVILTNIVNKWDPWQPFHAASHHHLDPLVLFRTVCATFSQQGLQVGLRSLRRHSGGQYGSFHGCGDVSCGADGINGLATVVLVNGPVALLTGVAAVAGVPAAVVQRLLPAAGTLYNVRQ